MQNHKEYENYIKDFINNKLSFNERRKFVFHLDNCKECKDMLLDEYVFNVIFNDKDGNINSSYTDNLNNLLLEIKQEILEYDKNLKFQYYFLSFIIIFCAAISMSFVLSVILNL